MLPHAEPPARASLDRRVNAAFEIAVIGGVPLYFLWKLALLLV